MPEGPETHRMADQIERAIGGKLADHLFFAFDHLKRFQRKLKRRRILSVRARGKAILTSFEGGLTVYSHNQLYGKWFVRKRDLYPDTRRQLRFAIHTAEHSALLYSASDIEVLDDEGLVTQAYLSRLGPDLLDGSIQPEAVIERASSDRFLKRRLGALLLDQSFLAGVGNYLRSEILFDAGVHPEFRPADCSDKQLRKLAQQALVLARRSYRTAGITNEPKRVRDLKKKGKRRPEYRFMVFAREGKLCYRCRGRIRKIQFSSRRLYFCPGCQPGTVR
jgi:endonuclease-8